MGARARPAGPRVEGGCPGGAAGGERAPPSPALSARPPGRRPSGPGFLCPGPLSPGSLPVLPALGPLSPESLQLRVPGFLPSRVLSAPAPFGPSSLWYRRPQPRVPRPRLPSAPGPPSAPSPPGPSAPPRLRWPHSWVGSAWAPVRPLRRGDPSPVLARAQAAGGTAFWAWCPGRRAAVCRCRPLRLLLTGFGGSGRRCESSPWAPLALGLVYCLLWALTTWRGRSAESLSGPAAVASGTLAALQGVGVFSAEWSSNVFRFSLWTSQPS